MDQRVRYRIENKKDSQRAALLSRLDDCAEQTRECGILALGIERALNKEDWNMVERLTLALNRIRESQQKAKERARLLVNAAEFKRTILEPLISCVIARVQEAVGEGFEETIDKIHDDYVKLQAGTKPQLLLEGPKQ